VGDGGDAERRWEGEAAVALWEGEGDKVLMHETLLKAGLDQVRRRGGGS
jgi:hypothetical protein